MQPELLIEAKLRDVDQFQVRRALPSRARRLVGPFIFFDHLCRVDFAPGQGMDVRPHPHIGLATVTYLFEGAILHRDSLGSVQPIRPGDVNWMIAGRGVAHSERTPPEERETGSALHAIQCWVALPEAEEEIEASFVHHPAQTIPRFDRDDVTLSVIAGDAYGERSPVRVLSPTLYVHAAMAPGSRLAVDEQYAERAVYVVAGGLALEPGGRTYTEGELLVLPPHATVELFSAGGASAMLLGGEPLGGQRHVDWNFVSSSLPRIEQAKLDWRAGRFGKVIGDEQEFIPLPEPPAFS